MNLISLQDEKGIEILFQLYFDKCVNKSYQILGDFQAAEDLTQELFSDLWTRKATLNVSSSLGAYILKAIYNRSLNYIKAKKINFSEIDSSFEEISEELTDEDIKEKLLQDLEVYIECLPEKCRIVFSMSKFEQMSYAQIASELGISIKTVENQIGKALKILKNNFKKK